MWNKDNQNLRGILDAIEKIEEYVSPFADADAFFEHKINYFGIDAEEVWQIAKTHLSTLKTDVKKILEELD